MGGHLNPEDYRTRYTTLILEISFVIITVIIALVITFIITLIMTLVIAILLSLRKLRYKARDIAHHLNVICI